MHKIIKKFLNFSDTQKKKLKISLIFGFFMSMFKATDIIGIYYVTKSIIEGTVNSGVIWGSLGIIAIGIVGGIVCNYFSTQLQTEAGYTMGAKARVKIAEHLKYVPMGYFNDNNIGRITNTATNTAESLQEVFTRCFVVYVQGLIMASVITISMLFFDWRIALITFIGIVAYLVINSLMHNVSKQMSNKKVNSMENAVVKILEYIQGISVIKSYNLTGKANAKVAKAIKDEKDVSIKMELTFIPWMALGTLVTKLFSIGMCIAAILFYINGSMILLNTIMVCISSFIIYSALDQGGTMSALLRMASLSIDKINDACNTPVMDADGKTINTKNKDIELKNVEFSYDKRKIIDNVSLRIPEKSTLAIVGGSGCGKTTLCNLITRFWDVDKGCIKLGEEDIRKYNLDSLLSNFSMVFQNVYLFNDTIANNIKFGKPNATMKEVKKAAKKACCDEFISALPNGYDTIIGEGGASISGGEKQRISIARAIIKDSPIIILDEATANVDPENESQLQKAIEALTKEKTVIMIAHRLKTVKNADKIIVLDNGKIIENGTHDELLKNKGKYADFIGMREQSIGWKLGRQAS